MIVHSSHALLKVPHACSFGIAARCMVLLWLPVLPVAPYATQLGHCSQLSLCQCLNVMINWSAQMCSTS